MTRFSTMYGRELDTVLAFLARRTLDVTIAADLCAETFALAFESWHRLESRAEEEVRAWLFTVARRQLSHYLRHAGAEQRAVRRLGIRVPSVHEDEIAVIEERAGLAELRAELQGHLGELGLEQREALRLRVIEERPYPEVAAIIGISEQTARARVSRGLRALRAALEQPAAAGRSIDVGQPTGGPR